MISAEIRIIDTDRPNIKPYMLNPSEIIEVNGDGFNRKKYKFQFEYITIDTHSKLEYTDQDTMQSAT